MAEVSLQNKEVNVGIGYSGSLTMKTLVGDKVVRTKNFSNSGTDLLFRLLAQTIAGIDTSSSMPRYLDIGNWDSYSEEWKPGIVSRLTLQDPIVMEGGKVKFTTSFGYYDVIPTSKEGDVGYTKVRLYNLHQGGDHLAQIELSDSDAINSANMNIKVRVVLEWVMSISNK